MNYKVIDFENYYRKGVFEHFSKDCKCSLSITNSIDVTQLYEYSKKTGTKFYINFLYLLSKTLNSRMDYKLSMKWDTQELIEYDKINPTQYVFHDDTETFTIAYTEYFENYVQFYAGAGFVVALAGDIMTMPGLPKAPAALNIDVDDNGIISGLF